MIGKLIAPLTVSLLVAPVVAGAQDLSLSIPLDAQATVTTATYQCSDDQRYSVRYINSGANSLAVIKLDDQDIIFADAISGSGARYLSGPYEWWSKGDEATLTNAINEGAKLTCKVAEAE